jgi:hypothetical protein
MCWTDIEWRNSSSKCHATTGSTTFTRACASAKFSQFTSFYCQSTGFVAISRLAATSATSTKLS